jgi:transcriptional regulator with XRE-family HTH domain
MVMDFRKATDQLLEGISHEELANALGVSVATVRQARLDESAKAHRNPPDGWETTVRQLAEKKAQHFRRLAEKLGSL